MRNIADGTIDLEKAKKKKKKKFRSKLSETTRRKWRHKSEEKKKLKIILKSFTKQEKRLADSLMIMRQLYLRLNKK